MPTCKSCGARILWAKTPRGKPIPLDETPDKRFTLTNELDGTKCAIMVDTYVSHFATCPDAAQHRKTEKQKDLF